MYLLTPKGIEEKARITVEYLKLKMHQYEELRKEIEELQREFATHAKQLTTPATLLAQKPMISKRTDHTNSDGNA
jgi:hypothetical protein